MDQGQCSECPSDCKLRICVTCVKKLKILSPSVNNSWKLNPVENSYDRAFLKAKLLCICSDCAADKHEGHTVVRFRDLGNLRYESNYLLANGALFEQKLEMENAHGEWQGIVTHFKRILVKQQVKASLSERDDDDNDFTISVPALKRKQAEFLEKRKKATEKCRDLTHRETEFQRSLLKEFISCGSQVNQKGDVPLEALQDILNQFPPVLLDTEKISLIDKEIEIRMIALESALINRTLLPYDGDEKYFKFKAIRIAYLAAMEERKRTEIAWQKRISEVQDVKVKLLVPLNQNLAKQEELIKEENQTALVIRERHQVQTAILFYAREIIEKQLEVDQAYIEHVRAAEDKNWIDLMIQKYFPKGPMRSGEDQVYIDLMSEFLSELPDSDDKDLLL